MSHGHQTNCSGLLSRTNTFHIKKTTGSINTLFLITFFDDFVVGLNKPTVVVLDNARIHHSKVLKERCNYWQEQGLYFVYLPPYSPYLNITEKCWHELKQRWLKPEDYCSFEQLAYAVQLALMAVGTALFINFKAFKITTD